MKFNKDGSVTFEITSPDCDDTIALEKMMGYDREKVREQVEKLTNLSRMEVYLIDKDGNYIKYEK